MNNNFFINFILGLKVIKRANNRKDQPRIYIYSKIIWFNNKYI